MKKVYLIIIAVVILVLILVFAIANQTKIETSSNKLQVAASFYPLYFFSSEIGRDYASVFNITPAGVEPHDYDPTPQDVARIQNSGLLVINGAGFEPWFDKLENDLQNVKIVNTSENVKLQEGEEHDDHGDEHNEEEHGGYDPHIWLSPVLAKSQVDKILQGYIQADPNNRENYEENARDLKSRLDELDSKYRKGLSSCQLNSFVTSHAAFGYLAQEYNLTQIPISGLSPDEEPSSSELAEVVEFAEDNNINYIFFESLVSPKLAETIADEVGAKTLVLDPMEGLSEDDIKQGKSYFTVMEDNLKNLQTALSCSK